LYIYPKKNTTYINKVYAEQHAEQQVEGLTVTKTDSSEKLMEEMFRVLIHNAEHLTVHYTHV